ncbi:MAG: hypothetical protein KDK25_01795 [Leptospiraceae bacterium]|nr:hypothetical protein [Leptospiraceae bacterium]MCB1169031.1 hypothetical protein [Leptospiraceae bacterium]
MGQLEEVKRKLKQYTGKEAKPAPEEDEDISFWGGLTITAIVFLLIGFGALLYRNYGTPPDNMDGWLTYGGIASLVLSILLSVLVLIKELLMLLLVAFLFAVPTWIFDEFFDMILIKIVYYILVFAVLAWRSAKMILPAICIALILIFKPWKRPEEVKLPGESLGPAMEMVVQRNSISWESLL